MKRLILPVLFLLGVSLATSQRPEVSLEGATVYNYEILKIYPHDPTAFTEGLEYHEGDFFEGTGVEGRSDIRRVKLDASVVNSADIEMLEDLIAAAASDAQGKAAVSAQQEMSKLTGGMDLPFKLPF